MSQCDEKSHSFPDVAEDCSPASCSDGEPSDMSSVKPTDAACSRKESQMGFSKMLPSIVDVSPNLFAADTQKATRGWLMSCQPDFHASHSQTVESNSPPLTSATPGLKRSNVSRQSNRMKSSSKTSPACWPVMDTSAPYSKTWPEQGIMQHGLASAQKILELPTKESASGYWLTPIKQEGRQAYQQRPEGKSGEQINTTTMVKNIYGLLALWNFSSLGKLQDYCGQETASALILEIRSAFSMDSTAPIAPVPDMNAIVALAMNGLPTRIQAFVSGVVSESSMNLSWLECLMGMPEGWTDLKPLEMPKWESWLRSHTERLKQACGE